MVRYQCIYMRTQLLFLGLLLGNDITVLRTNEFLSFSALLSLSLVPSIALVRWKLFENWLHIEEAKHAEIYVNWY